MEVQSKILSNLSFDPGILIIVMLVLILFLLIMTLILMIKLSSLSRKYKYFMKGKNSKTSIEELLKKRIDEIDKLKENDEYISKELKYIQKSVGKSFQKFGVVKYDAFKEMGGKLSFAYAILDDYNSGYILNSIHSREGCYTYIKEIINGESFIPLSDEEQEAFDIAKQNGVASVKSEPKKKVP